MVIGIDARELQGRPTGVGRYLRSMLRAWSRGGGDRLVAYFDGPAPPDPALENPCIVKRPLGDRRGHGVLWQERTLPRAARRDGLDVFFAPAYVCPLSLDIPRATTIHDLSFFSIPDDFAVLDGMRRRLLVRASVRASAAVLADSEFTRRELERYFPEHAGRFAHLPIGLDDDLPPGPSREEARRRLALPGPMLLAVGSILNRRRVPELLRAVARLARSAPDLTLDIVGENRTHPRLDLPALVRSLGLERRVRLSGFVSEAGLAERYAAADVAIYLSEYEGFGLPVLEAMARGVPVVTSLRPATGEVFGAAALLVDPRDVAGIAAALDNLLRQPATMANLVAQGRSLAARFPASRAAALARQVLASVARR